MKKGQAAVIGFAVTIVLLILIISLLLTQMGYLLGGKSVYKEVESDAGRVADLLMSRGYPENWDTETVLRIGLLDGDKVSIDKLEEFSKISFSKSKLLLGVKYDYLFFIEKADGSKVLLPPPINQDFFGWNGYIAGNTGNGGYPFDYFFSAVKENANHIAKSEKFIYLDNDITGKPDAKLVVYTWDISDFRLAKTECNDGINNDMEDTLIDLDDPGCLSLADDNETDPSFSGGGFQCRITGNNICYENETEVLRLSEPFGLFGQFHAGSLGIGFPYRVCCYYRPYIGTSCLEDNSINIINLEKQENAHIEEGNRNIYENSVCLNGLYKNIECWCGDDCGDDACLFSISGYANAHIKGCISGYDIKICCRFTDGMPGFVCGSIPEITENYVVEINTTEEEYTIGELCSLEEDKSRISNLASTSETGYIIVKVQKKEALGWNDIDTIVEPSTSTNFDSGDIISLTDLWDAAGKWDSTGAAAGTYRVYAAVLESAGGAVIKNSNGSYAEAWREFELVS